MNGEMCSVKKDFSSAGRKRTTGSGMNTVMRLFRRGTVNKKQVEVKVKQSSMH
jgi:hypothetical protein